MGLLEDLSRRKNAELQAQMAQQEVEVGNAQQMLMNPNLGGPLDIIRNGLASPQAVDIAMKRLQQAEEAKMDSLPGGFQDPMPNSLAGMYQGEVR